MTKNLLAMLSFLTACCLSGQASAADWQPQKPVELIVGVAPGGALDVTARDIQRLLQQERMVDAPVSVVNRPGAGSAVAWTYMNQHSGDGHYLSVSAPNLLTNSLTGGHQLTYTDVTPLAILFNEYIACSVKAGSPVSDGRELVRRLRQDPGSLSIGIASARGATNHIAAGAVFSSAGIDIKRLKFVVFKSSAESLTALIGGHVDVDFSTVSNVLGHHQGGRIAVLGITAPRRLESPLQDVPTWTEQGWPVDFSGWRGIIGPAGMTAAQTAYWEGVFARLVKHPEWQGILRKRQWATAYMNSAETRRYLDAQSKELAKVLTGLGLSR